MNNGSGKIGAVIIGGTFQALGIIRSLARHDVPVCLLDSEFCIARYSRYLKHFFRCPSIHLEARFLEFLKDLAIRQNLAGWVIYPDNDEVVSFLAKHKKQLEGQFLIPTPEWNITRWAGEKKLTYRLAEKIGIPVPRTIYPREIKEIQESKLNFPVIIKPSVKEPFYSLTKKKAIRVGDYDELQQEFYLVKSKCPQAEIMVQELIPGAPQNLYSVGSFFKSNEMLGRVVAHRTRQHPMDFGHATTYACTVDIPELEETARQFLQAMGYYGLSEIEFMLDPRDGKYKLIEMNARTWGWHTLAINAGVDLPYLLFQDMLGQKTAPVKPSRTAKWIHLVTDFPTVLLEIGKGRMTLADYFKSLMGLQRDAVFSARDPLPFIMELLMAPYLRARRGF
jgi:D-aspartate ligase